ncbi:MAG TPA: FAD-dependent oxidoreductase, partial [Ardenticatenaceae bacterium]|nr:FAD-dependent oxidoreductase [Ardenticatenaceae bacterium]
HVTKSAVVRIPQSVYWPKPGLDRYRPSQATPISNLVLAGGYTRQRFYDSMEGAVRSGNRAAAALLSPQGLAEPRMQQARRPVLGRAVPHVS